MESMTRTDTNRFEKIINIIQDDEEIVEDGEGGGELTDDDDDDDADDNYYGRQKILSESKLEHTLTSDNNFGGVNIDDADDDLSFSFGGNNSHQRYESFQDSHSSILNSIHCNRLLY